MDGKSEYLICIGLLYSQEWNGQLSEAATAILQQHATQGDLTELQVIALRWRALAQQAKDESHQIHFKVLFEALKDLEKHWDRDLLSNEEVSCILSGFSALVKLIKLSVFVHSCSTNQ